jgi:hypothetical protein
LGINELVFHSFVTHPPKVVSEVDDGEDDVERDESIVGGQKDPPEP